jgi:hypothetical protein
LNEINAWELVSSTDWDKMCSLKVLPNWKDLGKRLGKQMKEVAKAVNDLTHHDIVEFMNKGSITLVGFEFTKDDLVVKREFNGDNKRYEAGVSDDGRLMVAIDTLCDDEVLQELRAKAFGSSVQKLRKSGGLVPSDRVEIFYQEGSLVDTNSGLIAQALAKHSLATIKRVRGFPVPLSLKSKNTVIIAKETLNDNDLSKFPVEIVLAQPVMSVDPYLVRELFIASASSAGVVVKNIEESVSSVIEFIQTLDYDKTIALENLHINVDGVSVVLQKGVNFFANNVDMLSQSKTNWRSHYPHLPVL